MLLRILGCVIISALVVQSSSDWYVIRQLAANEICINSTLSMGGNANCPVPTFPIVNSTTNLDGLDKLTMLNAMVQQELTQCYKKVIRMSCVKATEVCSSDQQYVVTKVTQPQCMDFMACLPESQYPVGIKLGACQTLPGADATVVPGPVYIIEEEQKKIESASECVRHSTLITAAVLTLVLAHVWM